MTMEKKSLKKLSLRKEAISHLRPGIQARVLGGGSDVTCYDSGPAACDTGKDCMPTMIPCPRTVNQECNPYLPPESQVQTNLMSICDFPCSLPGDCNV